MAATRTGDYLTPETVKAIQREDLIAFTARTVPAEQRFARDRG